MGTLNLSAPAEHRETRRHWMFTIVSFQVHLDVASYKLKFNRENTAMHKQIDHDEVRISLLRLSKVSLGLDRQTHGDDRARIFPKPGKAASPNAQFSLPEPRVHRNVIFGAYIAAKSNGENN
jgi:hypothetical protein